MHVRTLPRILFWRRRRLGYFHFEIDWKLPGRIASGVVAGLIFQLAVQRILSRQHVSQRPDHHREGKVAAVDAQFLIRSEWETRLPAGWIRDPAHDDVCRSIQL